MCHGATLSGQAARRTVAFWRAVTPGSPTASVIVTSRDAGPWIRETLESVLAQSHTDFELVVVDADSQDETPEIVAELADADLRVRVVLAKRMSGSRARDVGVSVARGRYLVFCDGSDLVAEHRVRRPDGCHNRLPDIVVGDFLTFSREVRATRMPDRRCSARPAVRPRCQAPWRSCSCERPGARPSGPPSGTSIAWSSRRRPSPATWCR
ncbi:glycosyltransferase family 2 protein [Aeromicrobium sp. UC242_57]|uniref:glycosyltransferase family 2 protein n=1 Tax=Aeromicrobium sp. UC242_57 TaxID=3374624 RepID=UPI0037A6C9F5